MRNSTNYKESQRIKRYGINPDSNDNFTCDNEGNYYSSWTFWQLVKVMNLNYNKYELIIKPISKDKIEITLSEVNTFPGYPAEICKKSGKPIEALVSIIYQLYKMRNYKSNNRVKEIVMGWKV
jgi:hypothetical protein